MVCVCLLGCWKYRGRKVREPKLFIVGTGYIVWFSVNVVGQ